MFIIRRLLLFLNPVFIFGGLEWLLRLRQPQWSDVGTILGLSTVLLVFTVWDYTKRKWNKRLFDFLLAPFLLLWTSFYLLLFVENLLWYRVVAGVVAVLIYLFLEQILNYFYFSHKYQPYTLESFSFYINIVSVFSLATAAFSTIVLLDISRFLVVGVFMVIMVLSVYQIYWVHKISWVKSQWFLIAIPVAMGELALALSYWPVGFMVSALVIAVFFYLMVGLSRLFLLENLNRRSVLFHCSMGAVALVAALATAQWY